MLFHLSRGDVIFASPYIAFVKTPFSCYFESCNPESIKPNDYKRSNIINYKLKDTRKKIAPVIVWYSTQGLE